jgi:cytochrome c55X
VKRDLRRRSASRVLLRTGLIGVLLVSAYAVLAAPPTSERQGALFHLLKHDCGSCHGLTMNGGLGPPLLPGDLHDKDEEGLVEVILDGVPGTPMPPWRFELSREEAVWMVHRLKEGLPQ